MNYSEFLTDFAEDLQMKLQNRNRDVEVEIVDVEKPWEWKIGLRVSEGKTVCPVFYADEQYEYYKAGMNYQMIVAYMADQIEVALDRLSEKFEINFKDFKDSVSMQVLNTERSARYLEGKVHREIEDLSIVYRLNLDVEKDHRYSAVISKDMLELMELSEEELHQLALEKAPINNPYVIKPLTNMLQEVIDDEFGIEEFAKSHLMIVTTVDSFYGASALFYPDVLEACATAMNGDFYVIPSSVHEFLLHPASEELTIDNLKSIVKEVNDTVIEPEELLSYNIYHYDHKDKIFELAERYKLRLALKNSVLENLKDKQRMVQETGHSTRNPDIGVRQGR